MTVDDPKLTNSDGSIKIDKTFDSYALEHHNTRPLYELVRSSFYVRNTKESIGLEYDVPEVLLIDSLSFCDHHQFGLLCVH